MPKTGSKSQDQKNKDFAKCFKFMQGLVVVTMYHFDYDSFKEVFLKEFAVEAHQPAVAQGEETKKAEEEVAEESTASSKKKSKNRKKKNKDK